MTTVRNNALARRFFSGLLVSLLLAACTKPAELTPEPPVVPARYELGDIRYFLSTGDGFDTVTVSLKGASVQNLGNVVDARRVENAFDELVKTSQFIVDKPESLPTDLTMSALTARVPTYWNGGTDLTDLGEPFPLASTPQQQPYRGFTNEPMTVQVPPKSSLAISRQVDAYQVVCSFTSVVQNKATGERYPITGKWKGLLRYNNVSVTITQHPLP